MTNAEKDIQEVINDGEMLLYFEMVRKLGSFTAPRYKPGIYFTNLLPKLRAVMIEFEKEQGEVELNNATS